MAYSKNNKLVTKDDQSNRNIVQTSLYIPTTTTPSTITNFSRDDRQNYTDSVNLGPEISTKTLSTTFGREEDYVELHIKNTADQLIYSEVNFQDYQLEDSNKSIIINPEKVLSDRGYTSGEYILNIHPFRDKVFHSSAFPFQIKEISTSRREIKSISPTITNSLFDKAIINFILEVESASYFKEFVLNFGGGKLSSGINLMLNKETQKHELILKTLEALPLDINRNSKFKIVEEVSDPITININLGLPPLIDNSIKLMGPNFQIDTRQNNSIPSAFKSYNDILNYNITSSYNHLLNKLENPDTINIQYDYIRNVSSSMEDIDKVYHFENFTHFSSAVERLKNFKYKVKLLESYETKLAETKLIKGKITGSNVYLEALENIQTKKRNTIKEFDGYEHFLYFTSGSDYTWPKSNSSSPYELYSVSSSKAKTWLGDSPGLVPEYSGQLLSASFFDRENPHNLKKLIPEHILENKSNALYVNFVNMMGQHFDYVWTHIKHLTEVHNADNKFGISKELVYYQLKSLGLNTFDQFENTDLLEYILGEGKYGNAVGNGLIIGQWVVGSNSNNFYNISRGITTYVTSSNEGSVPKGQITKEIWKRLYNNAPYLTKTKGTERGLNALMNCYGVPSTILNVKEYGGSTLLSGPLKDLDTSGTYKTFSYEKSGLVLKGNSGPTGSFITTKWSSSLTDALSASAKTVEFRIKPNRLIDDSNQHLFTLSGSEESIDPSLRLTTYVGTDISASNDASQHGKIDLIINDTVKASTANFPIFNGDFWNIYIGVSGSHNTAADITFGAYQANWLKHVSYYTSSFLQPAADRQLTFGDPTFGGNNIGGGLNAYFGGMPKNDGALYDSVDTLIFSGSIQEIKYHFGELLSPNTLKKHALEPFMYSGNTLSSSLETVVLRLPLGSNDQENSGSFHPHIETNFLEFAGVNYSAIQNGFIIQDYSRRISSSLSTQEWEEVVETHHLPTPDTVGASMTSEKVRIDTGTIYDNILLVNKKTETSTLDRQPPEYEDLGIYFSPTSEINEDIIYTLGSFRLDDYIGNPLPSAQSSSVYERLKDIQKVYNKKLRGRYNYWDYIKLIQNYDHTLFKIIENFVPFKANTKTGLLIEPTYLERSKFQREVPIRSDGQTMTTGSHQTFEAQLQTYNDNNRTFDFAPTNLYTPDRSFTDHAVTLPNGDTSISRSYHPIDPFATSSNKQSIKGQFEPGSYVVSNNNLTFATSSKYSERLEQGTNGTIEIFEEYLTGAPRYLKNAFGALHADNSQFCQAPIRPLTRNRGHFGIGAASIGSSFTIGQWYNFGGGNPVGVNFSGIENGFIIEDYVSSNAPGVGTSTIGSSFIVGFTQNPNPRDPKQYRTHKSNTILGNVITGRKSKKYFQYQTYTL
tara:strand:+ start:4355 stop:8494 length:4140 start_codon:yes stop_codon:yes gene_type:complete